jgi:DNA-binding response OmpR family regulator
MSEAGNILIVEDEVHLAQGLLFNLQAEGYRASIAGDGTAALDLLLQQRTGDDAFDAVLLDVMLPGKDGFQVLEELRGHERYVPVLMLTARGRAEDVLRGFTAGADDYLAKPFDLSILLARLKNLLRRMAWSGAANARKTNQAASSRQEAPKQELWGEDAPFRFGGRTIDFANLELATPEKTIHLTLMEADLLRYLVHNRDRIVSRKELLEQVWRVREDTDTRAIDNFVVRLRRYIEDRPSDPVYLQTVRGVGYRFMPGNSPNGE